MARRHGPAYAPRERCAWGAVVWLTATAAAVCAEQPRRSLPAVRATAPPVIDGRLEDACWADAPVATDFTCHETRRLAAEQTLVRVVYDDAFVYVAFECLEPEPGKIQATERKDDRRLWGEDWVEVQFDTFHDRRTRYIFVVNTLGTRFDARIGVNGWNTSWDSDWPAACTVTEDRWYAELAVPIGELHFLRGDDVTWGINFHREENGREESSTWSYDDDNPYAPRHAGDLTGLDLSAVKVTRRPQLEAYVSATGREERGGDGLRTGLDVSLRLSPTLVGAFTVNPDFGQVEADTDTIELRDTERRLPERRPFFREGAEVFRTPFQVYYSRRIFDIKAGAKVTGVSRDWQSGLLNVEGEILRDDRSRDGNFLVARYIRNVGKSSYVGVMAANSQREDGHNRVGGFDTGFQLTDALEWESQVLGMLDEEEVVTYDDEGYKHTETVRRRGYAMETELDWEKRPVYASVGLRDVSKDFQPDLGYIPRRDIRGAYAHLEIMDDVPEGPVKWYGLEADFDIYENHDGDTTLRDFSGWFGVDFRNKLSVSVHRDEHFHAPYDNRASGIGMGYNTRDWWHGIEGGYTHGVFEDVPYDEVFLTKPLKIGQRLTMTLTGNHRWEYPEGTDEDGYQLEDRAVWLWRCVSEYTFEWDARVKFTVEQTSEDRHNVTLLFAWHPRKDTDVYLVLNDWQTEDDEERGIFAKLVRRF